MEHAWIASTDAEVEAALTHPDLLVRPPDEPVPASMRGTRLGDIFARLARMNDGQRHTDLRPHIEATIGAWDLREVGRIAAQAARSLPAQSVAAYTVAVMIGLRNPEAALPWIHDFATAIAAGAGEEAVSRGNAAAHHLLDAMPAGSAPDDIANALGLLFQASAATARLIETMTTGAAMPPVVMTRRWAARDTQLCGQSIRRGDAVAVLLTSPRFHFGAGAHACPGQRIAYAIAQAASQGISNSPA